MPKPLPHFLGLGQQLGPTCTTLSERGYPRLAESTTAAPPPPDARVLVLLAPDVLAKDVAALDAELPGAGVVVVLTHRPDSTDGADGFLDLLEACRNLASRRRLATLVGPDASSLTALAALASELDDHALVGADGEASRCFFEAHTVAGRVWAAGDVTLVTRDVSATCLAEALGLLMARQLVEQLPGADPEAAAVDTSAFAGRAPAYVKEAGRPLRELLESTRLELPPPVRGSDPQLFEADLDQNGAQARTAIGRERLQLLAEGARVLDGAGGTDRRGGLLAELDHALAAKARRSGASGAVHYARALDARFKAEGAGSPPMQLEPRIAALEARREEQRRRARDGGEGPAAESTRTVQELLKLARAQLLGEAAATFWRRVVDHLTLRTAQYERLASGLADLRSAVRPRLRSSWERLGLAPKDAAVSRFIRALQLTRAAAEQAVLPGADVTAPGADADADAILQALTTLARSAIDVDAVPPPGAAAAAIASGLEDLGLLTPSGGERLPEQVLYGLGVEHDARKLALGLDTRPRCTQVAAPGLLAWVRLSPGLPLSALTRRLGLGAPLASGEHEGLAPLGDGLTAAAARAAYAIVCDEVAGGRLHEAIAAYRKAASAAVIHKDPLGPLLAAVVKLMQATEPQQWARSDAEFAPSALDTPRPEEGFLAATLELAAVLRKSRELEEDSARVYYVRDAERLAWELAEKARATLADPEQTLLATAFERLGTQLRAEVGDAYGKPVLALTLATERLSYVTQTRLEVKLVNTGRAAANDVRLRVTSAERIRLLSAPEQVLDKLAPGVESVIGFDLKPLKAGKRAVTLKLSFADRSGQRIERSFNVEPDFIPVRASFSRIELNPFVAGPPIQAAEMFFGRKDVLEFVASNLRGAHQDSLLLLHGARRTGKSSIFYRLGRGDLLEEYVPVYLDLQGLGDFTTESFLSGMARRIVRTFRKRGVASSVEAPRAAAFVDEPFETFMEFLEDFEEAIAGQKRALVLIDEFEILESKANEERVSPDVFPFLRSVTQHSASLSFILAGTRRLDEMDERYWSVFYGLVRDRALGFLEESEMQALVTRPLIGLVEVDDLALEAIFRLTSGHPYYTQLICQTLVSELNRKAERNFVLLSDVLEAAQLVLSLGGGQITHEWASLRSPAQRLILAALAELGRDAAVWVERDELAARLEQSRAGVSPEELSKALAELARRELVTTPSADAPVRYRMDLLRQWVRQEKPIAAVRAEDS